MQELAKAFAMLLISISVGLCVSWVVLECTQELFGWPTEFGLGHVVALWGLSAVVKLAFQKTA